MKAAEAINKRDFDAGRFDGGSTVQAMTKGGDGKLVGQHLLLASLSEIHPKIDLPVCVMRLSINKSSRLASEGQDGAGKQVSIREETALQGGRGVIICVVRPT